ncbi:unnamed protein product [Rotaria sp. Silwood1]|nr:unnamed protein product [Rotaria sp. Silwood1]
MLVVYLSENEPTPLLLYDQLSQQLFQLFKADLPYRSLSIYYGKTYDGPNVYYPYTDTYPTRSHGDYISSSAEAERNQNQISVFGIHRKSPLLSLFVNVQINCPFDYTCIYVVGNIQDVVTVEPLLDDYRKNVSVVYGDKKLQLYSLHAHRYLVQQVLSHGALFTHGCFGDESFLGILKRSRRSNIRIPYQIFKSYLLRDSQYAEEQTTITVNNIFVDEKVYDTSYLNQDVYRDYFTNFRNLCQVQFNETVDNTFSLCSRFQRGIIKFSSLLYSRIGSQLTNIVFLKYPQCFAKKNKCFGIIIWYFKYKSTNYAFLKQLKCTDNVIRTTRTDQLGNVAHAFVDRFYSIVDIKTFELCFIRVEDILHQCIVIPFYDLHLFSEVLCAYEHD